LKASRLISRFWKYSGGNPVAAWMGGVSVVVATIFMGSFRQKRWIGQGGSESEHITTIALLLVDWLAVFLIGLCCRSCPEQ
jgi:hypothetical protein